MKPQSLGSSTKWDVRTAAGPAARPACRLGEAEASRGARLRPPHNRQLAVEATAGFRYEAVAGRPTGRFVFPGSTRSSAG